MISLDAGTAEKLTLPRFVAEYVTAVDPELEI